MSDFYTLEKNDFYVVRGDSLELGFNILDQDGLPIDISIYNAKFSVKDKYTDEIFDMLPGIGANNENYSKIHDDSIPGGGGVFFKDDVQLLGTGITIPDTSKILVILSASDTELFSNGGTFVFDLELENPITLAKKTPVRGTIIVRKGYTV